MTKKNISDILENNNENETNDNKNKKRKFKQWNEENKSNNSKPNLILNLNQPDLQNLQNYININIKIMILI